jgi:hypothetical protein
MRWKESFPMRHAGRFALTLALVMALAAAVHAGIKVKVDYDKEYDFTKVRTFGWHPDGAGEVKILERSGDDPEAIRTKWEPTVKDAVEKELAKRGLVPATSGTPDLYIHYYFLVGPASDSQYRGQFVGAIPPWGVPDFEMTTTSLKIFEQGTLILDIIDGPKRQINWRGKADAEVNRQNSAVKRDQRIREAVAELLKKFPPKPKK